MTGGAAAPAGRTTITARALSRVASAVSGDALGVAPGSVDVGLADDRGGLALSVTAPIRVVALSRVRRDGGIVDRTGGTVLDRASRAQSEIRDRMAKLTGSHIARVDVRIASADIREEPRVR